MPDQTGSNLWSQSERLREAGREAIDRLRRRNAALGYPMVVWRDGRVVEVDPLSGRPLDEQQRENRRSA